MFNKSEVVLKLFKQVIVISIMLFLAGFTIINNQQPEEKELDKVEVAPVVEEVNETENTSLLSYIDKGEMVASWYGPRFHGRPTANGETFDEMAFTAAHKKLRFGTLLRVSNPRTGNSVIVRINDRGPFIRGRHLDLSRAAAMELGMIEKGVEKLKVEQVALNGVNFPVIALN